MNPSLSDSPKIGMRGFRLLSLFRLNCGLSFGGGVRSLGEGAQDAEWSAGAGAGSSSSHWSRVCISSDGLSERDERKEVDLDGDPRLKHPYLGLVPRYNFSGNIRFTDI